MTVPAPKYTWAIRSLFNSEMTMPVNKSTATANNEYSLSGFRLEGVEILVRQCSVFQNPGKIFLEKDTVGRCQHPVIFKFVEKIFFIGSISVESLAGYHHRNVPHFLILRCDAVCHGGRFRIYDRYLKRSLAVRGSIRPHLSDFNGKSFFQCGICYLHCTFADILRIIDRQAD